MLELVLQRHHELDRVERIGAEVVDEGLLVRDVGFRHAQLLGDDLLDACFDVAHDSSRSVRRNSPDSTDRARRPYPR